MAAAVCLSACDAKQHAREELVTRGITDYSQVRFVQAVSEGNTEIVSLFIKAGMNPNTRDDMGCTVLVTALRANNVAPLNVLIEQRADVNAKCTDGTTPLIHAAKSGKLVAVQILLDASADPNATDEDGLTALNYTQVLKISDVSSLLALRGAKLGKLRNPKALIIEGSDMSVTADKKKIVLTATLRNHSDYPAEFPQLRVIFTNSQDDEVFASILQPSDYLSEPPSIDSIWPAKSALHVKAEFQKPPNAEGYSVDLIMRSQTDFSPENVHDRSRRANSVGRQ